MKTNFLHFQVLLLVPLLFFFALSDRTYSDLNGFYVDKTPTSHKIKKINMGQTSSQIKSVETLIEYKNRNVTGMDIDGKFNALYICTVSLSPRNELIGRIEVFDVESKKSFILQDGLTHVPASISVDYLNNRMIWIPVVDDTSSLSNSFFAAQLYPYSPINSTFVPVPGALQQVALQKNTTTVYYLTDKLGQKSAIFQSLMSGDQVTDMRVEVVSNSPKMISFCYNSFDNIMTYMGPQWAKIYYISSKFYSDIEIYSIIKEATTIAVPQVQYPNVVFSSAIQQGACTLTRVEGTARGVMTWIKAGCETSIDYLSLADTFQVTTMDKCSVQGIFNGRSCVCRYGWQPPKCISCDDDLLCYSRGVCNPTFGNCTCFRGYSGDHCEVVSCFSKRSDDPTVCSGHGKCIGIDACQCDDHYRGAICTLPVCFGKTDGDPGVCSGRGMCKQPDFCSCTERYSGSNCQYTTCGGVNSTLDTVCSSHGTCTDYNTCKCVEGRYLGQNCEISYCFGTLSTDPRVCSSRGVCSDYNHCNCSSNYHGDKCELTTCFGLESNNTNVCSGRGQCIDYDTCKCSTADYFGKNCNITTCFDIASDDPKVCNGRGSCIRKNKCSCDSQYHGDNCELTTCFDVPSELANVCNGHGKCIGYNTCKCNDGYSGPTCSGTACFGKESSDPLVCSARGTCVSPNNCSCSTNYSGKDCSLTTCSGVSSDSPAVCSSKGTCIDFNACNCTSKYYGTQCEAFYCYGYLFNSTEVCSRNGSCIAPDTCKCNEGYSGKKCTDIQCHGKAIDDPAVCSAHGKCTGPDTCKCSQGYDGDSCQLVLCFGVLANETISCSARGTCTFPDHCDCYAGASGLECQFSECFGTNSSTNAVCNGHGTCIANDTCVCHSGFAGASCQTLIALAVTLPLLSVAAIGISASIIIVVVIVYVRRKREPNYEEEYAKLLSGSYTGKSEVDTFTASTNHSSVFTLRSDTSTLDDDSTEKIEKNEKSSAATSEKEIFTLNQDTSRWKIKFEDLKDMTEIGVGTSSVVYHAKWKTQLVAVKVYKNNFFDSNVEVKEFDNEVNLLISLNHPNVLPLYGVVLEPPKVATITEFCSKGSLFDLIRNENISWERTVQLVLNIAVGMSFLHAKRVIHRDLKCANIFVDRNYVPKIADFGISKIVESQAMHTQKAGTSYYMAPEITLGRTYSDRCDVFSFAIIMYEIYYGTTKPYGRNQLKLIENRVANDETFRPEVPLSTAHVSKRTRVKEHEWYITLMQKCWSHDPAKRPSFEQIVNVIECNL